MTRRWSLVLVGFGALLVAACGGGDDDDDSGSGTGGYGTCDLRADYGSCIEATGSPRSIADQKDGCVQASGLWSLAPCPTTAELIGCCEYTFGNRFRECFYEGTKSTDPVGYCTMSFDDGVWTPAAP
ncbi:MAG TPA: hypothetical protein VNN72_27450 [Polyangiaceae bacterium]|nr:hypothetical protein [Polyangiaceae bacterium]